MVSPEEDLVRRSKSRYVYGSSIDDDQDGGRGDAAKMVLMQVWLGSETVWKPMPRRRRVVSDGSRWWW